MIKAEDKAKELINVAKIAKKYSGIGSVTIEGTLEEFKTDIDDFNEFLKIIDQAGYCIKPREKTHLGLFPADENEFFVFIEK